MLLARVKHLASLHNPEFYQRQKLRLSTWRTPRFVRCHSEDLSHLHLPRGVLEPPRTLLANAGSRLDLTDQRPTPAPLPARPRLEADLTGLQQEAVEAMLAHDHGVLVAPPGTGKTVMGCAILAARSPPTLVLVDRKPLLDQWRAQLTSGASARASTAPSSTRCSWPSRWRSRESWCSTPAGCCAPIRASAG